MQISEARFRSFIQCPKLYNFGFVFKHNREAAFLKLALEKSIASCLRLNQLDPYQGYMSSVLKAEKDLGFKSLPESKRLELRNNVGRLLNEIFSSFRATQYLPLTGNIPWTVKDNNLEIELDISCILKTTKSDTLHLIEISPYSDIHAMKNDLISWMKVKTGSSMVEKNLLGPKAVLHSFGVNKNKLLYHFFSSKNIPSGVDSRLTQIINLIGKVNYPVLPCSFNCPHKLECYL